MMMPVKFRIFLKADRMFVSIFCAMKIRHMRQLFCFEDKKFEILN